MQPPKDSDSKSCAEHSSAILTIKYRKFFGTDFKYGFRAGRAGRGVRSLFFGVFFIFFMLTQAWDFFLIFFMLTQAWEIFTNFTQKSEALRGTDVYDLVGMHFFFAYTGCIRKIFLKQKLESFYSKVKPLLGTEMYGLVGKRLKQFRI